MGQAIESPPSLLLHVKSRTVLSASLGRPFPRSTSELVLLGGIVAIYACGTKNYEMVIRDSNHHRNTGPVPIIIRNSDHYQFCLPHFGQPKRGNRGVLALSFYPSLPHDDDNNNNNNSITLSPNAPLDLLLTAKFNFIFCTCLA